MQHDMCDDAYSCLSKMLWSYQLNRWQEVGVAGRGWVMSKASKAVVQASKAWTSLFWYSSCYYFSVPFQATELPRSSQGERSRSIIEQIRWSCPVLSACECVCVFPLKTKPDCQNSQTTRQCRAAAAACHIIVCPLHPFITSQISSDHMSHLMRL